MKIKILTLFFGVYFSLHSDLLKSYDTGNQNIRIYRLFGLFRVIDSLLVCVVLHYFELIK
jgi:hypothetical protein